jgi:hypothetical protein
VPISKRGIAQSPNNDVKTQETSRGPQEVLSPVGPQPSAHPLQPTKNNDDEKEEEKQLVDRVANDIQRDLVVVTVFTGLLQVVILAIQVWFARSATRYAGDAAVAAKKSAEAALEAAKATVVAQRAYIHVFPEPPGLEFDDERGFIFLSLKIENFGETPAEVTDIVIDSAKKWPETTSIAQKDKKDTPRAFLLRGDYFLYPQRIALNPPDVTAIANGQIVFFVYGHIDYIDSFKKRYRTGFARAYDHTVPELRRSYKSDDEYNKRYNLSFVYAPGFNYDRERKPGEGYDWEE